MKFKNILIFVSLILLSCSDTLPEHSKFLVGMSRDVIIEKFGEPQRILVMTKSSEHVWGPIEDYWDKVPMGAKVEILAYDSTINVQSQDNNYRQEGQTELYFVNDSKEVNGIGFYIKGAVYEGDG